MNGRRAQAARNDDRILEAAREVFLANPAAPMATVAAQAGVGMSALYRRYPSKDQLLQDLAADGLTRFAADLELALADRGDPWESYVACLHRVLDGRSQALAQRLAGTFTPTAELTALATRAGDLYEKLHQRTRRAKALRSDVEAADIIVLLEMIMLVELPDPRSAAGLRRRYLTLLLQSLHAVDAERLPGPAASSEQLADRWRTATR